MPRLNTNLRARTGQKIDREAVRSHCVSVRLDDNELAQLDEKRGKSRRGEWLRMAAMDGLPQPIPEANTELSLRLSKLLGAFGSLMQTNKLDDDKLSLLMEMRQEVVELRKQLSGEKS